MTSSTYKKKWQEAIDELDATRAELERVRHVVDLAGIARHMHVARLTPQQWQQRDLLPPVDFPQISGVPLWYAATIREQFAQATGRHWCDRPDTCAIARLTPAA